MRARPSRCCGIAACALLLLLAAPAFAADDACGGLTRIATVDMTTDEEGGVSVPMSFAGRTVNLLIDTGGFASALTNSTVNSLGLVRMEVARVRIVAFGGARLDRYVTARDVSLGRLKAPRMDFLVMPDGRLPAGQGGTLAPNILRAYDDDFDFTAGTFSLFSPAHCPGQVVWWTQEPVSVVPIDIDAVGHITLPVQIDGKTVTVILDTGAARSILSLEMAKSLFGFDEKSPGFAAATDRFSPNLFKYPFRTLSFGGISVANPDILLIPDDQSRLPGGGAALIGMSVLRKLHLYIAYNEHKLYITAASAH